MTYYNLTKLAEEKSDKNKQSLLSSPKTHMGLGGLALAGSITDHFKNNPERKEYVAYADRISDLFKQSPDDPRIKSERDLIKNNLAPSERLFAGRKIRDTDNPGEYLKKITLRKINLGRAVGAAGAAGLGYGLYKHLKNKENAP